MTNVAYGQQIKQSTIDAALLTGPGEDLVAKTLLQLSQIPGFVKIFGPYIPPTGVAKDEQQRWADYQRWDWTVLQLPAINVFEAQSENKQSENAYLTGVVTIQIIWPASFRRPDARRVEAAFKGALENFFASQWVKDMLDELYYIQRPAKVYGLNEYGKQLTWTPNAEVVLESQAVPVTILDVNYRIDLRAWYRALEFQGRTKDDPFDVTLVDLAAIGGATTGSVDGVVNGDQSDTEISIQTEMEVTNP